MNGVRRVRMFARPNGSGKSTIASILDHRLLGVLVNADDIEAQIRRDRWFDPAAFGLRTPGAAIVADLLAAPVLDDARRRLIHDGTEARDGGVDFSFEFDSYFASALADVIRARLLDDGVSFSFETVMSHRSKVEFLAEARRRGYRTYLYVVATDDPQINVARVRARVLRGGHHVPEDRVVARYWRSLKHLPEAIRHADRSYVFDNSGPGPVFVAEGTDGGVPVAVGGRLPAWFVAALQSGWGAT